MLSENKRIAPKKLLGKWNSARKRIVNNIGNMGIGHPGIGEYELGVLGGNWGY